MSVSTELPSLGAHIDLQSAIEFVWREAEVLDDKNYDEWLRLWTPGGTYVLPIDRDASDDYASALNILYDDGDMRAARVKRLQSGLSISAAAAARTVRTVSRFVTKRSMPDTLELRCAMHVAEQQRDRTRVVAADVTYRLARANGALAIDLKAVRLIDSDEAQRGVGYLL